MTRKAMLELIEKFEQVPAEKVDMFDAAGHNGCGCIMFHFPSLSTKASEGIPNSIDAWLLDCQFGLRSNYREPTGEAGKQEALRRLRFCLQFFDEAPSDEEPIVSAPIDLTKMLSKAQQ